jgi:hypothetical protein
MRKVKSLSPTDLHHYRCWRETAEAIFTHFGDCPALWRCLFCAVSGFDDLEYPAGRWQFLK